MSGKRWFGRPLPGVASEALGGLLIVVEGPDSAGRSTHIELLTEWLEQQGHAVTQTGLTRSPLVGPELERAKRGNVLSPRTMSLFYATDFYDQLENAILPALRAGSVVLADRYIFTLMARDLVRDADPEWIESLYSMAVVPDAVFYLKVSMPVLIERTLRSHGRLDYWESGMDLAVARDWFDCFTHYQRRLAQEFGRLQARYAFQTIQADRSLTAVQAELRTQVTRVLAEGGHP
jgi:dTMP kinase